MERQYYTLAGRRADHHSMMGSPPIYNINEEASDTPASSMALSDTCTVIQIPRNETISPLSLPNVPSTKVKTSPRHQDSAPFFTPESNHHPSKGHYSRNRGLMKRVPPRKLTQFDRYLLIFGLAGVTMVTIVLMLGVTIRSRIGCESSNRVDDFVITTMKPSVWTPRASGLTTMRPNPSRPWTNSRLPRTILPFHYHLEITPHFYGDRNHFEGKIVIEAKVEAETRFIIFHLFRPAINLTALLVNSTVDLCNRPNNQTAFNDPYLLPEDGNFHSGDPIRRQFYYEKNEFYVVELDKELEPGRAVTIGMRFSANFSPEGLVKTGFKEKETGRTLPVALTNLRLNHGARRAFPCFDEPHFRAHFSLSIRHRPSVMAISNMNTVAVDESNWATEETFDSLISTRTTFAKTLVPIGPTSLSFAVGPFWSSTCALNSDAEEPRICVISPDHLADGEGVKFALAVARREFKWLNLFFGAKYPLPKLDLVVYPSDFSARVTSNWGLISMREDCLEVTEASNEEDKALIESRITNSIAKQWFGNMVTMVNGDVWLTEGLAAYLEGPMGWSLSDTWLTGISNYHGAKPSQRGNNFDLDIGKSRAVINMMADLVGMPKFRVVIRTFLDKYRNHSAQIDAFFAIFVSITGLPLSQIKRFADWIEQQGMPLVTVLCQCFGERKIVITQEPFTVPQWYPGGSKQPTSSSGQKWTIPIAIGKPGQPDSSQKLLWLHPENENELVLQTLQNGEPPASMMIVNFRRLAPIRVNYPVDTWVTFGMLLSANIDSFHPDDRAGLLDDAFELAKAGRLSYSVAFQFSHFLANETYFRTWQAFAEHVTFLNHMLAQSTQISTFQAFVQGLLQSARGKVLLSASGGNFSQETWRTLLHQAEIGVVQFRNAECYSKYYFQGEDTDLRKQLRRPILTAHLLANDNLITVQKLLEIAFNETTLNSVKRDTLFAVAKTQHFWILTQEFGNILENGTDLDTLLQMASFTCYSPQSCQFVLKWVYDNFALIRTKIDSKNCDSFLSWLYDCGTYFNTQPLYKEFHELTRFVEKNLKEKIVDRSFLGRYRGFIAERIRENIYWMTNRLNDAEIGLSLQLAFIKSMATDNRRIAC